MEIAPSVLSLDYSRFKEDLKTLNECVKYLHFDVMDGHFVPNITFGPDILKNFRDNCDLVLDVHLMINDPFKYYLSFINSGANIITFHFEALGNDINKSISLIKEIKAHNVLAGISVKPNTDIKLIEQLLKYVDLVLVMSVEPGFGGQKFMNDSLEKVKYLKEYKEINKLNYYIEIDGGINDQNALLCKSAGVDIIVAGSFVFNGDIKANIKKLKV